MIGGFIYPGSFRKRKRPVAGKKSKKKHRKHTKVKKNKNSKKRAKSHKKKHYRK